MILESDLDSIGVNSSELIEECERLYSLKANIEKKTASFTKENLSPYLLNILDKLETKFDLSYEKKFKLRAVRIEKNDKLKNIQVVSSKPHIDYNRNRKVMIYLNKVNNENGAFNIYDCDPETFESFRKNLKIQNEANFIKNLDISKFKSIQGEAGKLVFFDTNCPHFQGKFANEKAIRFNIRFDWDNKNWSYPTRHFLKKKLKDIKNFFLTKLILTKPKNNH